MAANQCGAKTRSGGRCQRAPMANGRCYMHGGPSTGPKTDEGKARCGLNRLTHGFYSDALKPEERVLWERASVGSVDDEIRLMRVKLYRLVELSGDAVVADLVDSAIEVATKHDTQMATSLEFDKREIKVKAPQYGTLIIEAIETIRKLELARKELNKADSDAPGDDDAPIGRIIVEVVNARTANADDGTASAVLSAA